jgi:hypothetical protein
MTQSPSPVLEISPRKPARDECLFYHSFQLSEGEIVGMWDLRAQTSAYLGEVAFNGRSVVEIGPASGFLSFYMEHNGALVTCVEPPMNYLWDVVPFEGFDTEGWRQEFSQRIKQVRNSFWYAHHALGSKVRMVEADAYHLPESMGRFDIGVLACVLLHCRNPFDMLESVGRRVSKTMVVTEEYRPALGPEPVCLLQPHPGVQQVDTWWVFSPQFFVSALGLLGFTQARVVFHTQQQPAHNREVTLFTVVCERP